MATTAEYMRERKAKGLCNSCSNKVVKGKWRCAKCLEDKMRYNRSIYVPHPRPKMSEEEKVKNRKRYMRLKKAKGLCPRCPNKVEEGKSRCRPCLNKAIMSQIMYRQKGD